MKDDPRYSGRPGSSSRWGVMRRMTLRRADGRAYLDRLRIVQTPWFGVYLHRMDAPDPGRDLHDHPWPFITCVLSGGYTEYRADLRDAGLLADRAESTGRLPGRIERRYPWRPRRMRLDEAHTIVVLHKVPTWTLVLTGRRVRNWGFYVPRSAQPRPGHYVRHDAYDALGRRELTVQEDGNREHRG